MKLAFLSFKRSRRVIFRQNLNQFEQPKFLAGYDADQEVTYLDPVV